jgi:hypothetical protein
MPVRDFVRRHKTKTKDEYYRFFLVGYNRKPKSLVLRLRAVARGLRNGNAAFGTGRRKRPAFPHEARIPR